VHLLFDGNDIRRGADMCSTEYPLVIIIIVYCLFVCLFLCVCTVTDFSGEDKASGVKFCTAVHRRPGQGISHFGGTLHP